MDNQEIDAQKHLIVMTNLAKTLLKVGKDLAAAHDVDLDETLVEVSSAGRSMKIALSELFEHSTDMLEDVYGEGHEVHRLGSRLGKRTKSRNWNREME